jgi:outer membrane immunogenic protein
MVLALLSSASVLAVTSGASAADLAVPRRAAFAPPVFSWTGLYVGGHFGSAWGTNHWDDPAGATGCAHSENNQPNQGNSNPTCVTVIPTPGVPQVITIVNAQGQLVQVPVGAAGGNQVFRTSHSMDGFLGGGQVGFNVQTGWLVWGAEVQGSVADINGHGSCGVGLVLNCDSKVDGLITFAGRAGFAADRVLIYIKGGGAWVHDKLTVDNTGGAFTTCAGGVANECLIVGETIKKSHWGWMWGTGVEYALPNNWSAKVEYNFIDVSSNDNQSFGNVPFTFDVTQRIHLVKFGVNYRLGPVGLFGL